MSKRQAGLQINRDDYDPDAPGTAEPTGTWQKADESVLAGRKIRKAKKDGTPVPTASVATEAPVQLTTAAADFLSQMRADVTAELAASVKAVR